MSGGGMKGSGMKGGEADAVRLLNLAQREIREAILPRLEDDARYRMRLVLNAMKLAAAELQDAGNLDAVSLAALTTVREGEAGDELVSVQGALQAALRRGELDGDEALYQVLVTIVEARGALVR